MPFDLASLSYGHLSRFKELASPFELGNLKRTGFQHSIVKAVPKFTNQQHYASFKFRDQNIKLNYGYGRSYLGNHDKTTLISNWSCHYFLLTNRELIFPPNKEYIDPEIASQIIMQPEIVILNDFEFHPCTFIFSHPCRKLVTNVILNVFEGYTLIGGELNLIFEAFPVLEELTINGNNALSDWINGLNDLDFGPLPELLVRFQGRVLLSVEGYTTKLANLFEKSGSKLTLSFRLLDYTVATLVPKLQRLGYCIEVGTAENQNETYVNVHRKYPQPMLIISADSTLFLDDYNRVQNWFEKLNANSKQNAVIFELPEVLFSGCHLTLTKTNNNLKVDRHFYSKNFHFEPEKLTIRNCTIDSDLLSFVKLFRDYVKELSLNNVHLPMFKRAIHLQKTFPNIEKLYVYNLADLFLFKGFSALKSITVDCTSLQFYESLRANKNKVKKIFKKMPSSFCLFAHIDRNLSLFEKIRQLGFRVDICTDKICIYNCVYENIRLLAQKEVALRIYPSEIEFDNLNITVDSPKVEIIANRITIRSRFPSSYNVDPEVRSRLILRPTVVKVLKCVDDDFFEFAEEFASSVKHLDLRECRCNNPHPETEKERIRNAFPNLVKIWDVVNIVDVVEVEYKDTVSILDVVD